MGCAQRGPGRNACATKGWRLATACCCSCATIRATLEALWAAWWAGLVVVPVNAKLHPREVEWIIADSGARRGPGHRDVAPSPLAGLARQIDVASAEAEQLVRPGADDPFADRP
jgi:acyl-CoA synthetase (AMP-forming)/AMP-acid ligase II